MTALLSLEVFDCKVNGYKFLPLWINRSFQPQPVSGRKRQKILDLIQDSSRQIKNVDAEKNLDDEIIYRLYENAYKFRKVINIMHHFLALGKNPAAAKLIGDKVLNFLRLIIARFHGQRIRW
jgi:hypothetical protein